VSSGCFSDGEYIGGMNSSTHTKQMKVGQWTRLGLGIGGALIIWGAPGEIGA